MSVGSVSGNAPLATRLREAGRAQVRADRRVSATTVAVVLLTLLAAFLRFYRLSHQGFWFDEANTAADVHYSPGHMLGLLPQNETTPPLFYCVAWVWARVFGFGELALRSLPAVAGVLTVPVMYLATAKLVTRRAGLVAAALTACNPFLVWYSQEFRPYEPLVLLSAATLLTFAYVKDRPDARATAAWAVISALAIADHYYAFLVVVPEAVYLLYLHRRTRTMLIAITFISVCGLALLPLAISQNSTGNASWIAPIPLMPRLGQIVPEFLIGFQAPAARVLERIAEAGVLVSFILLAVRGEHSERRGALLVGAIVVSGFALNLILIAGGVDDLITRNLLSLWPPAAVLVATGLGAQRAGWVGPLAVVAVCATGVVAVIGVAQDRSFQRPDWRAVGRTLGATSAAGIGQRAILVQDYRDLLPLSLYVPHLKFMTTSTARVSELDVVSIHAPRVPLCWWGAACNLSGSRMQQVYAIPGFHVVWRRHAYQFTVLQEVASRPTVLSQSEVAHALRSTKYPKDELLLQRSA